MEDFLQAQDGLVRACEIRGPCVEGQAVSEIFREEAFTGTGDEAEGEVGVVLGNMDKLGEEMLAHATDS